MLTRPRFWIYRNVIALFSWLAFRAQKVLPLEPPVDATVEFRPFAEIYPGMPVNGLFAATSFPASDHAGSRLGRIEKTARLLSLMDKLAPRTRPIPVDEDEFLAAVFPKLLRRACPAPPRVPPELLADGADVIAELAVRGPFASYLRRAADDEVVDGDTASAYVLDLDWIAEFETSDDLIRPGGKAVFTVSEGRLRTRAVRHVSAVGDQAHRALLAGLNEHLTTFRHNISIHTVLLTSFALASTNHLAARHPVRRLLHHCFNTVLIGNRELARAQLSGPRAFAATIFSHDARLLVRMAEDHVARFDFWDFDPDVQFRNRRTTDTPFPYPYRDNIMEIWAETRAYVTRYLRIYYEGDDAVRNDAQIASWSAELDRLVPNGVAIPTGGVTVDWLARACATVIHVSTVEHDVVNNVVWNYSMFGPIIPTVVPVSGERMDRRRAFDLIATTVPTWKPYNMLLTADVPSLALDDDAAAAMRDWIERLDQIQERMARQRPDPSLSYPANLNVSISN